MRLSVRDISNFSKCPRFYNIHKELIDTPTDIIRRVMCKCYVKRTEYDKRAEWRVIMGWIDRIVFKDVDISDRNLFAAARKKSENIVAFLYKWYKQHYLKEYREGFNVHLERQVGDHIVYSSPTFVILADEPELWIVDCRDISHLIRDFELRLAAWLFMDAIKVKSIILKYLYVGPDYGMTVKSHHITEKQVRNINQYARHIADCISRNTDYTSITPMCYTCVEKDKCVI